MELVIWQMSLKTFGLPSKLHEETRNFAFLKEHHRDMQVKFFKILISPDRDDRHQSIKAYHHVDQIKV